MAGVGFELKKLFKGKGCIANIKAFIISSVATVGPTLLCIIAISTLQVFSAYLKMPYLQREVFIEIIIYSFVFSQIITSGFSMVVTRYVSDKLFLKEFEDILASMYGVIIVCLLLGTPLGMSFLYFSRLSILLKVLAFTLFMELIIMWLLTIYLSAFKDYMRIVSAFLVGVLATIVLGYEMLKAYKTVECLVLAMCIGILITDAMLMSFIKRFFKVDNGRYFKFIAYFDKYPSLFWIGFLYTFSLYGHIFLFWGSNLGVRIAGTFYCAPVYDIPVFYSYVTMIPAMVLFTVSVETSFYDKYLDYYSSILWGGSYSEIEMRKRDMSNVMWQEIRYVMEVQLFISIISIILGILFLPYLGVSGFEVDIFIILVLGCYAEIMMLIVMLIMLYFDDRKDALMLTVLFFALNMLLTSFSISMGESFYGFGFFVSALISLALGLVRLAMYVKNIDYHTFCSQPMVYKEKTGMFTHLAEILDRLG